MAILVRRARLDDAEALAAHMGHPQVLPQLLQVPYTDAAVWRERLPKMLDPDGGSLLLVAELDGQVVGNAGLQPAGNRLRRRHAMGLGMAVDPACWGRGVGSGLLAALLDWADRWAGVLRVELQVYTDNARAIALYRRHGFVVEGTHRAYALRDGAWADVHSMARLHPSPPALPPQAG
jgi:putative acetyltransferase